MKTITRTLSQRPPNGATHLAWSQKEVSPLITQLVNAANTDYRKLVTGTTRGALASVTLWTSDEMPEESAWLVSAKGVGRNVAGEPSRQLYFSKVCGFSRATGGSATKETTTTVVYAHPGSGFTADFAVSGNTVTFYVNDEVPPAMDVTVLIQVVAL